MYRTSLLEYERSYVQTQIIGPYYELVEYILERNIIIIVRPNTSSYEVRARSFVSFVVCINSSQSLQKKKDIYFRSKIGYFIKPTYEY